MWGGMGKEAFISGLLYPSNNILTRRNVTRFQVIDLSRRRRRKKENK